MQGKRKAAKRNGFDCIDEAARRDTFASAVPPLSRRGNFCLLPFGPEPVRSSLVNQVISNSSEKALLTPCLVWTLGLHAPTPLRTLRLKPSTAPGLLLAGLQAPATTPGRSLSFKRALYRSRQFCAFVLYSQRLYYRRANDKLISETPAAFVNAVNA
uniref:Uncharacterized protein n=1 Tax=Plectus sambesii TaxID=2011161 RepID=A0A914X4R0_9BILA